MASVAIATEGVMSIVLLFCIFFRTEVDFPSPVLVFAGNDVHRRHNAHQHSQSRLHGPELHLPVVRRQSAAAATAAPHEQVGSPLWLVLCTNGLVVHSTLDVGGTHKQKQASGNFVIFPD